MAFVRVQTRPSRCTSSTSARSSCLASRSIRAISPSTVSKKNFCLASTSLIAMLLLSEVLPSTLAADLHSLTFLVNRATGRTLDSNDEGEVYANHMNHGAFQKWLIHGDGDTYDLTNVATGRVLDSNMDGLVYTAVLNTGPFQKWRMYGEMLQNVATGRFLDSDANGDVYTLEHKGGPFQHWQRQHETRF